MNMGFGGKPNNTVFHFLSFAELACSVPRLSSFLCKVRKAEAPSSCDYKDES